MRTIKLIQGAYGYRAPGSVANELITTKSPPFEVDDDEALRLIRLGVAEYAEIAVATPRQEEDGGGKGKTLPTPEGGGKGPETHEPQQPEYGEFMTVAQLKAYADKRGIEYEDRTTKAKLIAAIDAFHSESVDDGEQPPALTVQDPVQ